MASVMNCNAHLIVHPFVGLSFHTGYGPPYMATIPYTPALSFSVLIGSRLQALPSWDVQGPAGLPLLGRENDSGLVVPHVHIGPQFDWFQLLSTLFGGSEVFMGAGSVQIPVDDLFARLPGFAGDLLGDEETAVGSCLFPGPISLNVGCSDPFDLPLDLVIAPNTILVGISLADILYAIVMFAVSAFLSVLGGALADEAGERIARRLVKKTAEEAAQEGLSKAAKRQARDWGADALERATRSARREMIRQGIEGVSSGVVNVVEDTIADAIVREKTLKPQVDRFAGEPAPAAPARSARAASTGPAAGHRAAGPRAPADAAGAPDVAASGTPVDPAGSTVADRSGLQGGRARPGPPTLPTTPSVPTSGSVHERMRAVGGDLGAGAPDAVHARLADAPDAAARLRERRAALDAWGAAQPPEAIVTLAKDTLSGFFPREMVESRWSELAELRSTMLADLTGVGVEPSDNFWGGVWQPHSAE